MIIEEQVKKAGGSNKSSKAKGIKNFYAKDLKEY